MRSNIISYFASADMGLYTHVVLQYHERPKAKRGIVMPSVDEFPYPRKQTVDNKFIRCSNNVRHILKRFRSTEIPAIPFIWPKSLYKHSVTRPHRSSKKSGRRLWSQLWHHQWCSFLFISCWWHQTWDTCTYFTVISQSEVRVSTEHGIEHNIAYSTAATGTENKSELIFKTDTPYLILMGELWGVYCEECGENWLHFNGTAL